MESGNSTVVCIDGSTLSHLLFKLKNAPGDAEGFLIGEVCRHCVSAITDSQSSAIREEKKIHILSFIVLKEKFSFYDHFGNTNLDKIEAILGSQCKHLIGWFSYRYNTSHRLSLREKSVHCKLLSQLTHIENRDFLFGLITEALVEQTPIHSTEYSFHTWSGSFRSVEVDVVNLKASGTVPYQTTSISSDLHTQHSEYSAVLQGQSSLFLSGDRQVLQATAVEGLYRAVLNRLEPLTTKVTESNIEISTLSQEVSRLQELADKLQREKDHSTKQEQIQTTDNGPEIDNQDNLIDLNSPEEAEKSLGWSTEQPTITSQQSELLSRDILDKNILEPSSNLRTDLLQPLVVENTLENDGTGNSNSHEPNSSYIQQSQELF